MKRSSLFILAYFAMASGAYAATAIPLTINLSEAVIVTGSPRVAVDVGGQTRYATYTSGSGTNALTFTLLPQTGDVDLDGITVSSPIDLNGGTMKDAGGNDLASLTFTPPNTSGIKVNYPSLGMDFVYDADGRYTLNGTVYNDLTSFLAASGGTFTRASIGTYYDSTGTLQTAASGVPRFDYDPVTHAAKGILIEESKANLFPRSSEFNNGWTLNGTTLSADVALSPDGTTNADKLVASAANANHSAYRTISATASTYTLSVYAKKAEMSWLKLQYYTYYANFDLNSGVVGLLNGTSSSIQSVGNGWYRCSFSFLSSTASNAEIKLATGDNSGVNPLFSGNGSDGLYIWGAQLEQGSFATSYIPTTSAAVTRAADNIVIPVGAWYNQAAGSIFQDVSWVSSSGSSYPMFSRFDSGSTAHQWSLFYRMSNGTVGVDAYYLSVGQGSYSHTPATPGHVKIATAQSLNNANAAFDGSLKTLDTSWTPPNITQLYFSLYYAQKWISKFKYYPLRAADTQLQLLSQ